VQKITKSYAKLANLDIFRGIIKKAVIAIPYNASASSIIEYLKDSFDQKKNPNFYDFGIKQKGGQRTKKKDFDIYEMKVKSQSKAKKLSLTKWFLKKPKKSFNYFNI